MRLAKAGFYGGDPENILKARADLVMQTYHYENFTRELDATFTELNNKSKG